MNTAPVGAPVVKFNAKNNAEFFHVLRARVEQYFTDNQISKNANANMVFKTIFMFALYLVPFVLILTGTVTTMGWALLLWAIMGLGTAGIGLAVMHDANHGSYSKVKWVNDLLGLTMNALGGSYLMWRIQHNVLHHMYTNIDGYDEDLDAAVLRMSPNQKAKKGFRFQWLYAVFFYGLMTLFKILVKDYIQVFRYSKNGLLKKQGETFVSAIVKMTLSKLVYFFATIGLPIILTDFSVGQIMVGWLLMQFVGGLTMALIFQSAHVLEETQFYEPDENGCVENSWAVHQMQTTANFANGGRVFSWFIGGLNYQVEHHLFPNICHVHFRNLSPIVKQTAKEFNVPYHENTTFTDALADHFGLLKKLGRAEYLETVVNVDMG